MFPIFPKNVWIDPRRGTEKWWKPGHAPRPTSVALRSPPGGGSCRTVTVPSVKELSEVSVSPGTCEASPRIS
ncbi:MAG: hypothetical protein E6K10_04270 [Methanobacteriota archaeon]|nr:MAG: hypothetical protein E6K10_04270 [Euryarchaeota archaeon]